MEKTHKIALLSFASCFAVAATLSAYSAKLCRNIEASAENVYETRTQVIPLEELSFAYYDGHTTAYSGYPLCVEFSRNSRAFTLAEYALNFDVSNALLVSYLSVGSSFSTEYSSFYRDTSDGSVNEMNTYLYVTLHSLSYDYLTSYNYGLYFDESNYTYNVTYEFYGGDILALTVQFSYELWDNGTVYAFDSYALEIGSHADAQGLPLGDLPFVPYFSYDVAFNNGYTEGRQDGYIDGYADGINNATDEEGLSWKKLFTSMIDVPINAIRSLFNFEILGYNVASFLYSILTIAVVLTVVNLIL